MWKDAEAVIFDLDGTLVDSMWIWKSVDIDFFKERNIELPDDLQGALDGMSFRETAVYMKNRFGFTETPEELMDIWNEMAHKKYQYEAPLKEGVLDFLKALKEKGIKPRLAVIMVGDDKASEVYVRNKSKACDEIGIEFEEHLLNSEIEQKVLIDLITKLF